MAKLRVSLANKCQILFGFAVVLILAAAFLVLWHRMEQLVVEGQRIAMEQVADEFLEAGGLQTARQLARDDYADPWLNMLLPTSAPSEIEARRSIDEDGRMRYRVRLLRLDVLDSQPPSDPVIAEALQEIESIRSRDAYFTAIPSDTGMIRFVYARGLRRSVLDAGQQKFSSELAPTQVADPIEVVLFTERYGVWSQQQLTLNFIYLVAAGLFAGLLAIVVFWLVTTRLILSPVRVLRDTAEKVAEGNLNIRSDINTGDEFEQLSDTFNTMLANTKSTQDRLRQLNKQLDVKLGELEKANLALFEANRLKTDFLANVSHELRTPLNSIIGFGELLDDTLSNGKTASEKQTQKQQRYIENIITSGRNLLEMINDLLDLAKIEAGRIELHVEPVSLADVVEALSSLISPQADAKPLSINLNVAPGMPLIHTDPGKLQQIVFNFLSNAVKFTPPGGWVEVGADLDLGEDEETPVGVRIWVADDGPGIARDKHDVVFDKFRQLDESHTKVHSGTGLGLAISRELARLLQGRITLESDVGEGAKFTLYLPMHLDVKPEPLMPDVLGGEG